LRIIDGRRSSNSAAAMNKSSATKVGESTATLPQTAADASTLAQTFTAAEEQKIPWSCSTDGAALGKHSSAVDIAGEQT